MGNLCMSSHSCFVLVKFTFFYNDADQLILAKVMAILNCFPTGVCGCNSCTITAYLSLDSATIVKSVYTLNVYQF